MNKEQYEELLKFLTDRKQATKSMVVSTLSYEGTCEVFASSNPMEMTFMQKSIDMALNRIMQSPPAPPVPLKAVPTPDEV